MNMVFLALIGALVFLLRLLPIRKSLTQGCDAFYFLKSAETFKKNKTLPIVFESDNYILESTEQWYPPLFSVFLGCFPPRILKKYYWSINIALDFFNLTIYTFIANHFYGFKPAVLIIFIYSIYGPLVMEFRGLTSRSLGLLLFNLFAVTAYLGFVYNTLYLALLVVIGCLILYAHKLTSQLMIFLLPVNALIYLQPLWIALLVSIYLISYVIYPSFFMKIQLAHWDIIKFWARNSHLLGAHTVYQSLLYDDQKTRLEYYKKLNIGEVLRHIKLILSYNYFVIFIPLAFIRWEQLTYMSTLLFGLIVGTYCLVALTTFIPPLRALGLGVQYIKYTFLPSILFVLSLYTVLPSGIFYIAIIISIILTIRQYYFIYKNLSETKATQSGCLSEDMSSLIEECKKLPQARIFCLPYHLCDLVAYYSNKKVLWGTHGFGFENVQPLFPVLKMTVSEVISRYNVTHCIVDETYCNSDIFKPNMLRYAKYGDYAFIQVTN